MSSLAKGAMETVSPAQSESGFYSRYFLSPQKGWWSETHTRSQTSESHPYETVVQDDYIKADPLANMPRGLVIFIGSERCLLSHPDSPPPQVVLEIRLRGSGLLIHGPPLWAVPGSPHFYEVHGCGSFPTETDGNPHAELPRRLAHFGPVGGRASISQSWAPQLLRVPRTQGKFCQERAVPQPTNFVPGNSYLLSPNEGGSHTSTCTGHSAACGFIQTLSPSPSQMAKTLSSSTFLHVKVNVAALAPLVKPSVDGTGCVPWSTEGRWSRQTPPT